MSLILSACVTGKPLAGQIKIGRATIQIDAATHLPVSRADIDQWVRRAAIAVTNYLGRFPVKHLLITVEPGGSDPVGDGVTHGGSRIDVRLGPTAALADLRQDWVMTHEMFHLAFPTLDERYLWMMEGLSDYLEPIARARVGQMTDADVWREFVEGLPQGLPLEGDRGLDNTRTHDRIYWGGNLFWLLADVRIRVLTNNRRSVDDAIRAILAAGGDGAAEWPITEIIRVGDKATETTVLKDLHDELGPKPGQVDLNELWQKLGVVYHAGVIRFDDAAPWAKIRASMTSP